MGKQSGKNLAGFGKRKMPNRFNTGKKSRRLEEENVAHSPASTSSGELPNEESNGVVSEEETVYKEPSMYDKLLMTLGSSSKSVSAAYKLRKRQEEGISDSENSEDDGSESSSDSEDADNDEEGVDDEDPEMAGIEEHSEDSENEDDQETSAFDDEETHDSDAEQDLGTSSQSAVEPSMCLSSFDIHWGHKLTKAEVENLSKKKWTYEWEVPAVGMTKGNWAGTGECFTKVNVEHMDRFSREFGTDDHEDEKEITPPGLEILKPHKSSKPSDFQVLFGGNSKDDFMVGIKFTKRSIKLYGDFYTSDIIVASSVGLLKKIDEAKLNKEKDVDYLSSIEVLVIDHADVITMQNWDFLKSVVEQLNHIPSKQHGTDVMRIRPWYLDGYAPFYRQTILLSCYSNPDINNLFNKHCSNYHGKVKLVHEHKGVLPKVVLQVRQIYQRFDADSIEHFDDARFEYFTTKVFPKIKDSVEGGIMIFISSYFEYVRVRNFLKSQSASFCLLHEYAQQSDISRARVRFFEGKRKIMLYTERSHFYHRYKIRGIQNLIIYSLPERKEFYPEVVNMLDGSNDMACTVLFSQFDLLRLERIVGLASAKRMLASKMKMFSFS
ncbi:protein NUCLEOLAR FACTOR 1 isoform X4 [Malus sylvestris]|uniref:protein NUCLEOLAR FACTOR 1 isoform X4 n=1 Tax=Malus sylvestris TaxID=3752 RepID=UPI0021AC5DA7|nr:protein NUCLEOLAR FACTOR 1 isoform X4 [Malus sylvestris]